MKRSSLIIGITVLVLPIAAWAATSDVDFRNCMRTATINRENRLVEVQGFFNDRKIQSAIDRRRMTVDSWDIGDDRTRNNVQRDIDRSINDRDRQTDKLLREDIRNAQTDFRNAQRFCTDALRQRERDRRNVPVGHKCFGTDECAPPLGICTTEFGVCNTTCVDDACRCSGVCVLR